MRVAVVLCAWACGSATTAPPLPISSSAPVRPITMPPGWRAIDPPSDGDRQCASLNGEWRVALAGDRLKVERQWTEPKDRHHGSAPFPVTFAGRHYIAQFADSVLVGHAYGLESFTLAGAADAKVGRRSVHGVVRLDDRRALVFEGPERLAAVGGQARWLERKDGAWQDRTAVKLANPPLAYAPTADGVYALLPLAIVHFDHTGNLTRSQKVGTLGLDPDSMVVDPHGSIWIGMRNYVLRLIPKRGELVEQWYVDERCPRMVPNPARPNCDCAP